MSGSTADGVLPVHLRDISSNLIQFKWAKIDSPSCETCIPGQEGMQNCPLVFSDDDDEDEDEDD